MLLIDGVDPSQIARTVPSMRKLIGKLSQHAAIVIGNNMQIYSWEDLTFVFLFVIFVFGAVTGALRPFVREISGRLPQSTVRTPHECRALGSS